MATAADYRKWAEECFERARQASDESVREQYASLGVEQQPACYVVRD